jgi:hypothetical protein
MARKRRRRRASPRRAAARPRRRAAGRRRSRRSSIARVVRRVRRAARVIRPRRRRSGGGLFRSGGGIGNRVLGNAGTVLRAVVPLVAGAAVAMFLVRFLPKRVQDSPAMTGAAVGAAGLLLGSFARSVPVFSARTVQLASLGIVADGLMRGLSSVRARGLPGVPSRPGGLLADVGANHVLRSPDVHRAYQRLAG